MAFPLAALASAAGSLGGSAGNAAASLTGLSAASGGLSAKFTEIVNTASRFVTAFDPAIVAELNRQFHRLDAIIGQSLRPVITAAIDIVRGFGSAIQNVMRGLEPVIRKVTESIAKALQPAFDNLAAVIEALTPVFDVVADVVSGVTNIFGDIARAMRPVITLLAELARQVFASLFGADIGGQVQSIMGQAREAIQSFIKNLLLAVASFMKMLGATKALDALIQGLMPAKRNENDPSAPQNAQFRGLADGAKELMRAAFVASAAGGKGQMKTEDYLAGLLKEVQDIRNDKNIIDLPATAAEIRAIIEKIYAAMPNKGPTLDVATEIVQKQKESPFVPPLTIAASVSKDKWRAMWNK